MDESEQSIFKKIEQIKFNAVRIVDDVLAGAYRSAFKGSGMEFEEVREYQPGDEVRSIDWNVTARMGRPFIKRFQEERELTVMLLVDMSASSQFGSTSDSKGHYMAEIAAVLAFSAIKNNDKIGLLLFSDEVESFLYPKKGVTHVMRVVRDLMQPRQKLEKGHDRNTDLSKPLQFIGNLQLRRSICFLLSDFLCPMAEHDIMLTAKKHDLIGIAVTDRFEHNFPNLSYVHMRDLESGQEAVVDTSSEEWRQQVAMQEEKRLQTWKKMMQKSGASFIDLSSDRNYIPILKQFFKARKPVM